MYQLVVSADVLLCISRLPVGRGRLLSTSEVSVRQSKLSHVQGQENWG